MAQAPDIVHGARSNGLGLVAILAAGVVALWLYRPFVEYQRLSREIGALETSITQLERDNAALDETGRALDTPRGMELKLRELGWVRANERVVRSVPSYTRSVSDEAASAGPDDVAGRVSGVVAEAVRRLLFPSRSVGRADRAG